MSHHVAVMDKEAKAKARLAFSCFLSNDWVHFALIVEDGIQA